MTTKAPRILIIEDDADSRDFLCMLLEMEGYETVPASGVGDRRDALPLHPGFRYRHADLVSLGGGL
jgi:CheY-like chemotaxis protein